MDKQNIKILVDCIKEVEPRSPITSRFGDMIIFRGEHFTMDNGLAKGERHEFLYSDPKTFLNSLINWGLMLNGSEQNRVLKLYASKVQAASSLTL